MEENNELNDIILNKSGSGSKSKKLLLAIATLTLVLIIVLVIMNSLKSDGDVELAHADAPVEPSAPTEIIDEPLFEPVEVIEEGNNATASENLDQIAQKIKQESLHNTAAPAAQSVPAAQPKPAPAAPATASKPEPKPIAATIKTPVIKTAKPSAPSTATAQSSATGEYYIQVGYFAKEPSKALFERLKASGLKYTTVPKGTATKVLVGPFQSEKAARDVLETVRKNVESGAYVVKG